MNAAGTSFELLVHVARRYLQELAKTIGDDVYLAVQMGKRVMYADRSLGTQRISLDIRLGEPLFLMDQNPTAENIARFCWTELAGTIPAGRLLRIRLWETPRNYVDYEGH